MAEEEKKPKQRWTADELLVLLTYVQELGPNDKVNNPEVVDLLADEGYERTEKQVQKKFERLRYESKAQNIDIETRLQDLITAMYGDDDEPAEQVKSPKATPKSKKDEIETSKGKRKRWNVREHKVLLECLLAGQDKASEIADKFPAKDPGKVYHKLHNVHRKAKEKNIGVVEFVQQQIKRLQGEIEGDKEESSEEDKTPVKKGTKRKLEENAPEERSAKKQRFESPKPTPSNTNHNGFTPENTEVKKLLNQMASNSRENFNNLRKYVDGKFEEKRLQDAEQTTEIKRRMKNMEDNMDLMLREIRSLKSMVNGNNTLSKSHVSAPTSHTSNKDYSANNNSQNGDSSPSKQQISYFNFL